MWFICMAGLDGSNSLVETSASGCSTTKFTEVVLRGVEKQLGVFKSYIPGVTTPHWSHLLHIKPFSTSVS